MEDEWGAGGAVVQRREVKGGVGDMITLSCFKGGMVGGKWGSGIIGEECVEL